MDNIIAMRNISEMFKVFFVQVTTLQGYSRIARWQRELEHSGNSTI
jgi:hypothetical protein